MLCETHLESLSKTALLGERLPADAEKHLQDCAQCRAAFASEQELSALITGALQSLVRVRAPESLLPSVRAALASTPNFVIWRWRIFACATAVVAMVALVFSLNSPRRFPATNGGPATSPVSLEPLTLAEAPIDRVAPFRAPAAKGQVRAQLVTSHVTPKYGVSTEVLVDKDEQLGLQRYAVLLKGQTPGRATIAGSGESKEIEPLQIASIDVKGISIEPLERDGSR